MKWIILFLAVNPIQAHSGALNLASPLCLFVHWSMSAPLILGNNCVSGFTPIVYQEAREI